MDLIVVAHVVILIFLIATALAAIMATDLLGLIPGALERLLQGKVRRSWPKALAQGCALYG